MSNDLVAVEVWVQDPLAMPERVKIAIPNVHLDNGPRDAQFVVRDVDQNVCSRFRSSEMGTAPYPITYLKAPMA
jgi:hypothetical protein